MGMDTADLNDNDPGSEPRDARVRALKELVQKSLYVVDERAVAEAIIRRGWAWPGGPASPSGSAWPSAAGYWRVSDN